MMMRKLFWGVAVACLLAASALAADPTPTPAPTVATQSAQPAKHHKGGGYGDQPPHHEYYKPDHKPEDYNPGPYRNYDGYKGDDYKGDDYNRDGYYVAIGHEGPAGARGPTGPTGANGPTGPTGPGPNAICTGPIVTVQGTTVDLQTFCPGTLFFNDTLTCCTASEEAETCEANVIPAGTDTAVCNAGNYQMGGECAISCDDVGDLANVAMLKSRWVDGPAGATEVGTSCEAVRLETLNSACTVRAVAYCCQPNV